MLDLLSLLFLLVCCSFNEVAGQRNAEAEGMCQPFLTSNYSSPLIPDIRRNLKIDEDGEYYCELVLQDKDLPGQVRVTIHEGLSYLAIRHVQMGLDRHTDVMRHLKILAQLLPSNFNFQIRAGVWSLDPMLGQPKEAVGFLRKALYGEASTDSGGSEELKMDARKHYAEALGNIGEFVEAQKELLIVLERFPLDFGVVFLLKETMHQLKELDIETSPEEGSQIQLALRPSTEFYASITNQADVQYNGFKISKDWTPQEYKGVLPSTSDFETFVSHREPFIIRTNTVSETTGEGASSIDSLFHWNVKQWSNMDYLRSTVGADEPILVEKVLQNSQLKSIFGFSGRAFKTKMTFSSFLENNFGKNAKVDRASEYLNLQDGYFKQEGMWNNPLQKLQGDIPMPPCLESRRENISSVNMWMSNAPEGSTLTTRLHMDPLDSLYVVISGHKTFTLYSPDQSPSLHTISPTYGVSQDGFSFQYNSPANLPSLDRAQIQGHELGAGHYHYSSMQEAEVKTGRVVELYAGDVLFLPAGWYHEVTTASGPSVALNYWWLPEQWRETLALEQQMKAAVVQQLRQAAAAGAGGGAGGVSKDEL